MAANKRNFTVYITGHSFIKRLSGKLKELKLPTNFGYPKLYKSYIHGISGAKIETLLYSRQIPDFRPTLVVLHIGENDLDRVHYSQELFINKLLELVNKYVKMGACGVVLVGLFPRNKCRSRNYELKRISLVENLKELECTNKHLIFHELKINIKLGDDGVHIDEKQHCYVKYYHLLRNAIYRGLFAFGIWTRQVIGNV